MLSLANAFTEEDLLILKKILNYLSQNNSYKIAYTKPKIIGISASLTYINGY